METPSSTRRVTRAQTLSALKNNNLPFSRKLEETEKSVTKPNDRSALIDITNDSPIVGVAMGNLETPSSNISRMNRFKMTPGSGEALLRGQVRTLLQKVEEEAVFSKISFEGGNRFLHLQGFVNSPSALIAPTPANTPQISNLSGESINSNSLGSIMSSSVFTKDDLEISQAQEETIDSEKSFITRSLMLDFSEKSVSSKCFSDDSSDWSLKVNTSSIDERTVDYEEEEDDNGWVDDLCIGITKMSVTAKFAGKHTRFVYDSDGEIVDEEEMKQVDFVDDSPETMRLQGLVTPEGKLLPLEYGSDDDGEIDPDEECDESEDFIDVVKGNIRSKGLPNAQGKHLRFPEED